MYIPKSITTMKQWAEFVVCRSEFKEIPVDWAYDEAIDFFPDWKFMSKEETLKYIDDHKIEF